MNKTYTHTYSKIVEDLLEIRNNYTGKCVCHTSLLNEFGDHVFQLKKGETYDYIIVDSQGYGRSYRVYTGSDNKEYSLKPELFKDHLMDLKEYRDKTIDNVLKDGI